MHSMITVTGYITAQVMLDQAAFDGNQNLYLLCCGTMHVWHVLTLYHMLSIMMVKRTTLQGQNLKICSQLNEWNSLEH